MKIKLCTLFCAVSMMVSSCGYALVGRGTSLPKGIRSIAITVFQNNTGEPDLGVIITDYIKDEFIKDGRLEVKNPAIADSILKGVIKEYKLTPVAYDSENNVTEYKIEMKMIITHTATRTKKRLMKQTLNTDWRYKVDPSIILAEISRMEATKEAAVRSAETIISLVVESF